MLLAFNNLHSTLKNVNYLSSVFFLFLFLLFCCFFLLFAFQVLSSKFKLQWTEVTRLLQFHTNKFNSSTWNWNHKIFENFGYISRFSLRKIIGPVKTNKIFNMVSVYVWFPSIPLENIKKQKYLCFLGERPVTWDWLKNVYCGLKILALENTH